MHTVLPLITGLESLMKQEAAGQDASMDVNVPMEVLALPFGHRNLNPKSVACQAGAALASPVTVTQSHGLRLQSQLVLSLAVK